MTMQKTYFGINNLGNEDEIINPGPIRNDKQITINAYEYNQNDYMSMLNAEMVDPMQSVGYIELKKEVKGDTSILSFEYGDYLEYWTTLGSYQLRLQDHGQMDIYQYCEYINLWFQNIDSKLIESEQSHIYFEFKEDGNIYVQSRINDVLYFYGQSSKAFGYASDTQLQIFDSRQFDPVVLYVLDIYQPKDAVILKQYIYFHDLENKYNLVQQFQIQINEINIKSRDEEKFLLDIQLNDNHLLITNNSLEIIDLKFDGNYSNYFEESKNQQLIVMQSKDKLKLTFTKMFSNTVYFIKCNQIDASQISYTIDKDKKRKQVCDSNILCALSRSNNFVYNSKQIDVHHKITGQPPFKFYLVNQDNEIVDYVKFIVNVQFFRQEFFRLNPRQLHMKKQMFALLDENVRTIITNEQFSQVAVNNCFGKINEKIILTKESGQMKIRYRFNDPFEEYEDEEDIYDEEVTINLCDDPHMIQYLNKQVDYKFLQYMVDYINTIQEEIFEDTYFQLSFQIIDDIPVILFKDLYFNKGELVQIMINENSVLYPFIRRSKMWYRKDDDINNDNTRNIILLEMKDNIVDTNQFNLINYNELSQIQQMIYELKIKEVNQVVEVIQDDGVYLKQQKQQGFQWFNMQKSNVINFDSDLQYLNNKNQWIKEKKDVIQFPQLLVQIYFR